MHLITHLLISLSPLNFTNDGIDAVNIDITCKNEKFSARMSIEEFLISM